MSNLPPEYDQSNAPTVPLPLSSSLYQGFGSKGVKGIHSVNCIQPVAIYFVEEAKRNVTQTLFTKLFDGYQKEFLPRLNESEPVQVHFEFEIITIKEVVSAIGAVHTWCSGTSTWVPAQNGVVFTL